MALSTLGDDFVGSSGRVVISTAVFFVESSDDGTFWVLDTSVTSPEPEGCVSVGLSTSAGGVVPENLCSTVSTGVVGSVGDGSGELGVVTPCSVVSWSTNGGSNIDGVVLSTSADIGCVLSNDITGGK